MKSVSCSMYILVFFEYSNSIRGLRGGWKKRRAGVGARRQGPYSPVRVGDTRGPPGRGPPPLRPVLTGRCATMRPPWAAAPAAAGPVIGVTFRTSPRQGGLHLDAKGLNIQGCRIGCSFALRTGREESAMMTHCLRPILLGGVLLLATACATSEDFQTWKDHPTQSGSDRH